MGVALPIASVLEHTAALPGCKAIQEVRQALPALLPTAPNKCSCSQFQHRAGLRAARAAAWLCRAAVGQKPALTLGGLPAMQELQALVLRHHLLLFCCFEHRPLTWVSEVPMAMGHPACRSSLPIRVSLAFLSCLSPSPGDHVQA